MAKKNNNKSAIRKDSDKKVSRLNRAIYSATDPTYGYPTGLGIPAVGGRAGVALFNPDDMWYEVTDSVADAAWRKRLGLSYDDKFLIENKNGSFRLPKDVEMEIPTDTTALKRRIQANKKLADSPEIMGDDWKLVQGMIDADEKTLNALRRTYEIGEPVVINEYSHNSRKLAKDGKIIEGADNYKSPLNVLQNYTVQYNPKNRTMMYRDTYDFNGFESFVPGEPFDIEGEIPLRRYDFGGWFKDVTGKFNTWSTGVTDKFLKTDFGQGLSNLGVKSGNIGGIANTAATAIGGLLADKNTTGVGKAMQGIGSLASNIPGVGGLIGAGVNLVGGLVNAAFGSNINKEFVNQTEAQARQQSNYVSGASDNAALLSDWSSLSFLGDINKSDVGSDGWFSNKAGRETDRLNTLVDEANMRALASISNTAENIDKQNDLMLMANYSAYGGPIDMKYTGVMSPFGNQFKDGGIYIKPSKRGTFTSAAKKRGMGVQEFASKVLANKEDYSPAMVKKANFARNASKWKHDDGGPLDTRMELLRRLEEKRNRRGTYGGGKHGGGGAGSLFLESPDEYTLVKDTIWVPYRETFNDAFGRARAAGLEEFMFDNKAYTTELGDNPNNNRAGEERAIEGLLPIERTRQVKNKKAEGGELFTNGVTTIGNGGTHESNPYEGVQMGVDPQGIPNLVEEGEVIYDDYVFSNRLRVPKEVRQKYKLRGVTFADADKQLQKESEERPNDPISKRGLNAAMAMLQQEQETVRMKKESNKYANGGKLCNKFLLGGEPIIDNPYSPYRNNKDDYSRWFTLDPNNISKVTSYSDPYKNLIFTADMARAYAKNNPNDESLKSFLSRGNKLDNLTDEDVQKGSLDTNFGWLHKARASAAKQLDYIDESKLPSSADVDRTIRGLFGEPILNRNNTKVKDVPIVIEDEVVEEESLPAYKEIEPMKTNWLRYAPIAGHAIGAFSDLFSSPDYSAADAIEAVDITPATVGYTPVGNYLSYKPFDRDYYLNKLNADTSATRRAITNTSGGNRAAAMAGLLAADYNYGNQLGTLARQAEEYNQALRKRVEGFNRQTNLANAEMGLKAAMANAESRNQATKLRLIQAGQVAAMRKAAKDAYDARRSNNINVLLEELGGLGTENWNRDWLDRLAKAGVLKIDSKGNPVISSAKGGKIRTKKKKGFTYG